MSGWREAEQGGNVSRLAIAGRQKSIAQKKFTMK
jgi:hypothetical protein